MDGAEGYRILRRVVSCLCRNLQLCLQLRIEVFPAEDQPPAKESPKAMTAAEAACVSDRTASVGGVLG